MQTAQALSVTALKVVAATGAGSGNSSTATMATLAPGASLPLITTATYNNGTTSAPNGVTTTIIVTVGSVSGDGLMNPNPQRAAHAAVVTVVTAVAPTGAALPVAQPGRW